MWYRARVLIAVTVCILFSWLAVASQEKIQEMPISRFLDLIEEQRISDEQIRAATKGVDIEAPLRRAREQKRAYVIRKLLEARDAYGETPLISAVQSNNEELAQTLLDAKADPNCANVSRLVGTMIPGQGYRYHNRCPLAVAALQTINPDMVRLLLDRGAFDPDYNNGDVAYRLATTVFKRKVYGRSSPQEKTNLKEIESMLLLAARQRLLADTLRCDTVPQDAPQNGKREQPDGGPEEKQGAMPPEQDPRASEQQEQSWWKLHCIVS